MIYYLQHGGFYEILAIAGTLTAFLVYIGGLATMVSYGVHLTIEGNHPNRGRAVLAGCFIFFVLSLSTFLALAHR